MIGHACLIDLATCMYVRRSEPGAPAGYIVFYRHRRYSIYSSHCCIIGKFNCVGISINISGWLNREGLHGFPRLLCGLFIDVKRDLDARRKNKNQKEESRQRYLSNPTGV
jgi:hypothetical protein